MNALKKWISLALVAVLLLSLCACGKNENKAQEGDNKAVVDTEPYIGTWRASDHNGEDVVHYLIFDEKGYWNIYMNYSTLLRAIRQLPDQLVSFKMFCELQKSKHTGCYYEYVEDIAFTDDFSIGENSRLTAPTSIAVEGVFFTKISTHSGDPDSKVVAEARDLFDRALVEAKTK